MKKIRTARRVVSVTEEDIATAVRGSSSHCMIADAIQREHRDVRKVAVDLATIRFTDPATRQRYIYLTPATAQQALLDFDNGENPEPFSFRLGTPAHIVPSRIKTEDGKRQGGGKARAMTNGGENIPTRLGGKTPPLGALAAGAGVTRPDAPGKKARRRVGKIRSFGAKAMAR